MSTDRELLGWAAKAAGGLEYVDDIGWIAVDANGNRGAWWSPLTDDGDALRLAVKLRMSIDRTATTIMAITVEGSFVARADESPAANPYAATRRAIVRAAAEIGKHSAPSEEKQS